MSARARESRTLVWTDDLLRAFWGYYATERQEDYFTLRFGDRIVAETRRFYPADARICDYGCGAGFLLERLLQTHRAAGYDFSPDNLAAARARVSGHPNLIGLFGVGDAGSATFDVVYAVETVEHLLESHVEAFFAAVRRLLAPGGVLIATTPYAEDLDTNTVFCPACRHTFHRWQHVRSFSEDSIDGFMRAGGLERIATFTTDFTAATPWQRFKARLRPVLGRNNPHLVYVGRKRG